MASSPATNTDETRQEAWEQLEYEVWESHKRGRWPFRRVDDTWKAFSNAKKTSLGDALIELRRTRRRHEVAGDALLEVAPDPAIASANERNDCIARQDDFCDVSRKLRDVIDEVLTERDDGTDAASNTLNFLQQMRNDVESRLIHEETQAGKLRPRLQAPPGGDWQGISPTEPEPDQAARPENRPSIEDQSVDQAGYLRHAAGLRSGWVSTHEHREGKWERVTVWVRQNSSGIIIDRVTIKDSMFYRPKDPRLWTPDLSMPSEMYAMYKLRPLKGSEHIPRIRNWLVDEERRPEELEDIGEYRIYLEYCPFGDTLALINRYGPGQRIPEPFIWCIVESLTIVGLLMERGDVERTGLPSAQLLIHRDIKPNNIFLGSNTTNIYKMYPSVKLGDWGLCAVLDKSDPDAGRTARWRWVNHSNPPNFVFSAPEQICSRLEGSHNIQHLSEKSNVWEVGHLIWSLMTQRNGDLRLAKHHWRRINHPDDLNRLVGDDYSQPLRDLVRDCVHYLPENRHSFDQVLSTIRRNTGAGGSTIDYSQGIRNGPIPVSASVLNKCAIKKLPEKWGLQDMLSAAWTAAGNTSQPPDCPSPGHSDESHSPLGGIAGTALPVPRPIRSPNETDGSVRRDTEEDRRRRTNVVFFSS